MLTLLSPAKKQQVNQDTPPCNYSKPQALADTKVLLNQLKQLSRSQLKTLMHISDTLADLNYQRYQAFNPNHFDLNNSKPAIYAFRGAAYQTLNVDDFTTAQLEFAQQHLIILSGLYGYLRPLDLIQPYRLEMKTPLKNPAGADLYHFWDNKITEAVNNALQQQKNKVLINLASNEYFSSIARKKINGQIIDIVFKDLHQGKYKTIGVNAKRARGLMTRYIMKKKINQPNKLKYFNEMDYQFNVSLSSQDQFVFTR